MRQPIVIPRSWIRWALTIGVLAILGLLTVNTLAQQETIDRIERVEVAGLVERTNRLADIRAAALINCDGLNRLRASVRGTLTRARDFREREGTLTPAGAAFFDSEIAALADIDCRALVPGGGRP